MVTRPNVVIVHDYLGQLGGAERVVEEMCAVYPDAPVFTSFYAPDRTYASFRERDVRTTWLQHGPAIASRHKAYLPLYPLAFETMRLPPCDVVLSSSSAFAKGVHAPPGAVHICYCHAPARFAWRYDDYVEREASVSPVLAAGLRPLMGAMRAWDVRTNRGVDMLIGNSEVTRRRIREYYGRESVLLYPPVDVDRFRVSEDVEDFYLVISRLVGYKRVDLAVEAATLTGRHLVVAGEGPARGQLEQTAGDTVEFLGRVPDETVASLLSRCRALLFCGEEDFGIVPVEAMASGRPVIAYRAGGALETVQDGLTGVFFGDQTPESLAGAMDELEGSRIDRSACTSRAFDFRPEVFRSGLRAIVDSELEKRGSARLKEG